MKYEKTLNYQMQESLNNTKKETFPKEISEIYDAVMGYFDYQKSALILDALIKSSSLTKGKNVLELGIGTGSLAFELEKLGYTVEGIDHSPHMVEQAIAKGFPKAKIFISDAKSFKLEKKFDTIISHAGPLRMDTDDQGKLFFETYLATEDEVSEALNIISLHLKIGGLFIMSIQTEPERPASTSSTPLHQKLKDDFTATKEIINEGKKRIKIRTLKNSTGSVTKKIIHKFFVLSVEEFENIASKYSLKRRSSDSTKTFYVLEKI